MLHGVILVRRKKAVFSDPKVHSSLVIISYETAASNCELLMQHKFELIVCDKAHCLNNMNTKVRPIDYRRCSCATLSAQNVDIMRQRTPHAHF